MFTLKVLRNNFFCYTFVSNRPHLSCVAHISFKPHLSWQSWGRRERNTEDEGRGERAWRIYGEDLRYLRPVKIIISVWDYDFPIDILYRKGKYTQYATFSKKKTHCKITSSYLIKILYSIIQTFYIHTINGMLSSFLFCFWIILLFSSLINIIACSQRLRAQRVFTNNRCIVWFLNWCCFCYYYFASR